VKRNFGAEGSRASSLLRPRGRVFLQKRTEGAEFAGRQMRTAQRSASAFFGGGRQGGRCGDRSSQGESGVKPDPRGRLRGIRRRPVKRNYGATRGDRERARSYVGGVAICGGRPGPPSPRLGLWGEKGVFYGRERSLRWGKRGRTGARRSQGGGGNYGARGCTSSRWWWMVTRACWMRRSPAPTSRVVPLFAP
jgi:hypothetical protein